MRQGRCLRAMNVQTDCSSLPWASLCHDSENRISLRSPCLSGRAKIYDSGILCLTASVSHLGIANLFSPFTFDHWIWLSEICLTMNLSTAIVYCSIDVWSFRGQGGNTKIKWHNKPVKQSWGFSVFWRYNSAFWRICLAFEIEAGEMQVPRCIMVGLKFQTQAIFSYFISGKVSFLSLLKMINYSKSLYFLNF